MIILHESNSRPNLTSFGGSDGYLYHLTPVANLSKIKSKGLTTKNPVFQRGDHTELDQSDYVWLTTDPRETLLSFGGQLFDGEVLTGRTRTRSDFGEKLYPWQEKLIGTPETGVGFKVQMALLRVRESALDRDLIIDSDWADSAKGRDFGYAGNIPASDVEIVGQIIKDDFDPAHYSDFSVEVT